MWSLEIMTLEFRSRKHVVQLVGLVADHVKGEGHNSKQDKGFI